MSTFRFVLFLSIFSFFLACGDKETAVVTDTDTESETDTDTDGAVLPDRDACQTADDCNGDPCITVGDALVCQHSPALWYHECPVQTEEENECCGDSDCSDGNDGVCVAYEVGYCGGPPPPESNVCHYNECASDTECSSGLCLPTGVLNSLTNSCLATTCTSDGDCTDGTDGQCALLYNGTTCPGLVMSCVYTDAECRRAEGCDNGVLCVADGTVPGGASCQENQPPPAASHQ